MTASDHATQLEQRLAGFAPPVAPPTLTDADVGYAVEDTAVGRMLLAARVSPKVLRLPARTDSVRRQLEEFLAGRRSGFDVEVDLALAKEFQRDVLTRLAASVPYGERTTYGALAADLGRPSASRAVGAALGANPLCVVLPCHRVVAGSGALTGYAGGLDAKRYLLDLESSPR